MYVSSQLATDRSADDVCIDNVLYLGTSSKLLSLLDCRAYKEAAGQFT